MQRPVPPHDFSPFHTRVEFELAEFLYTREQMSSGNINFLMDLWTATLLKYGDNSPFSNSRDLYHTIDAIKLGEVPWKTHKFCWHGDIPERNPPPWMSKTFDIWFRDPRKVVQNMLGNPDFDGEIDYSPLREFDGSTRRLKNFMSGDWVWRQAVSQAFNPNLHMLISCI